MISADLLELSNARLIPNISLTDLQKSPLFVQDGEALGNKVPIKGIQHYIDALSTVISDDLFRELDRARDR